jgi:filamentous hemagglutinin family protein
MNHHGSMNRFFRLVWSQVRGAWVPVAENAKGRGKSGRSRVGLAANALVTAAWSSVLSLSAILAQAAPTGGKVVSGAGTIAQKGATTDVDQASQNLSINWLSFNVAPQETVNFLQPSAGAIAVNRISGNNGSQILGHLNANGQVYLINPNGILFGKGAEVNVGGLVASTLDLNDASFVGSAKSFSGAGLGSITNQGTISAASGGYVALLGNHVSNQGLITARLGTVALAGGSGVTLTFNGNSLLHLQVDRSVLGSLASNGGVLQADGGQVVMTAGAKDALLASVVNNTGVVEARTVESHDGSITLLGGMSAGTVNVAGTLDASAAVAGDGGRIETSGAHVEVAGATKVTTAAGNGLYGSWLIDPQDFTVAASGGDITGTTLSSELQSTAVTLQSSSGHVAGSGNVKVNDAVSWSANTTLTLTASNNVNVNAAVTATGAAAGVALNPNTANGSELASGAGTFTLGAAGIINLPKVSPNSKTALVIGGTPYTVINSLGVAGSATGTDLQGIEGNLAGFYALGSNINASPTAAWNSGAGFTPIGTSAKPFTGTLEGLGHTVSQLVIDRPTINDIGLIGYAGATAAIRDIGLIGGSVSGANYVGGLVGYAGGQVINTYATGNVSGSNYVGGLIGAIGGATYGAVTGSHATGSVTGKSNVGGLVGFSTGNTFFNTFYPTGTINGSYATGNVNGVGNVGGLVGGNEGVVESSFATGSVKGGNAVGGLVGANTQIIHADQTFASVIVDSYATGRVSGATNVGGLVGVSGANGVSGASYAGAILGSHATGTVSATGNYVGGLVGLDYGFVGGSHATGKVSGASYVGGLLGSSVFSSPQPVGGATDNNYATGNVSGVNNVGGLVGSAASMAIGRSYATGTVTGSGNNVGGLVGYIGYGNAATPVPVGDSYATGKVTGASNVGGLVGYVGVLGVASLENNYATGNVSGQSNVGGLVGYEAANGLAVPSIIDNYSTGHVSGNTGVGGLVGTNLSAVSDSYWNTTTSGQSTSAGGTPLTSTQMQHTANFAGFQFGNLSNGEWVMVDANGTLNNAGGAAGAVLPMLVSEYSTTLTNAHQVQLMALNPAASYTLAQNVTAAGTGSGGDVWGTAGFVPIGNTSTAFSGSFDGQGHDIANLTIDQPTANNVGLFGVTGKTGVVRNVGLIDASVSGSQLVGALVGVNEGSVSNSYATGTAAGSGNVGGLVGENLGTVSNDYASTTVNAGRAVGGLVGWNAAGTIEDSYATGNVTGSNTVGGLVGFNGRNATVTLDYASGHVVGSSAVGGLVGLNSSTGGGGIVSDSYWNVTTSGRSTSAGGGTGLTAAQMQTAANFVGFHFTTTPGLPGNNWVIVDVDGSLNNAGGAAGATSPLLASEYSTSIDNGHQLQLVAMNLSANYTLLGSVDLAATGAGGDVWGSTGFVPIGTINSPFRGQFDGNGELISNLTIRQPTATDVGLFGHTSVTAAVFDVGLTHSSVSGSQAVGALIGQNFGTVSQSFATGSVSGQNNVGGLVGASAGSIDNSYATSSVSGTHSVGGLVGYNRGTLSDNYSAGKINGPNTTAVGGLVGINGAAPSAVSGNFWDVTTSGRTNSAVGHGMTTAEMQTQANFTSATAANGGINPNWDFTNIWFLPSGSYPLLVSFAN